MSDHQSNRRTFSTTIAIPVEVTYEYHPGCKGSTEHGLKMEPDEEAFTELISIEFPPEWKPIFENGTRTHLLPRDVARELDEDITQDAKL